MIPQEGEPLRIANDHIEFVAVQNMQAFAIRCLVNGIVHDLDAAEIGAAVLSQRLVVIAGNEDDPGTLAHLTQQFLQDIVVRLQPDRPTPDPPEVYDVADQVNGVRVMLTQKVQKHVGLAGPSSEMHVRDK